MSAKHTLGPWAFDTTEDNAVQPPDFEAEAILGSVIAPEARRLIIARIWADGPNPSADARLIAAAPAMYEALREAAETIEWYAPAKGDCKCSGDFLCVAHDGLRLVRAALAAAEGRQP